MVEMVKSLTSLLVFAMMLVLLVGQAQAQSQTGRSDTYISLFATGTIGSNGADLSEDTLQTYTLPASSLVNVGDRLIIFASGGAGGTTDNKVIRFRIGSGAGGIIMASTAATASGTHWSGYAEVVKTGSNTQSAGGLASVTNTTNAGSGALTTTVTDTSTMVISITGQNTTNSVSGSITCQYFSVALVRAPS